MSSIIGRPFGLAVIAFALAYPQSPLFTDNQNTKFLHGAAEAGFGQLAADWTAGTIDPLPVFTTLVWGVYRTLPLEMFYFMFAALAGLYAWSLLEIVGRAVPEVNGARAAWILAALFITMHFAGPVRHLVEGFGGQYLLGHYLQPSVFGAFAMLAIALVLEGRTVAAGMALAVAVLFHPGAYLLAALLVLSAVVWIGLKQGDRAAIAVAPLLAFAVLAGPILALQAATLGPSTPEAWRQAVDILANKRIPHHTQVGNWLDAADGLRLAALGWACWLVRSHAVLFRILLVLGLFTLAALAVLVVRPDPQAGFATPWRTTVLLMPLSVAILAAVLSVRLATWLELRGVPAARVRFLALAAILAAVAAGLFETVRWRGEAEAIPSAGVMSEARRTAEPGRLYLVPLTTRDFEMFRLITGQPILANWKTHPYKDIEVLEWYARLQAADAVYRATDTAGRSASARRIVERYGVTHIVLGRGNDLDPRQFAEVYADASYRILVPRPETTPPVP